MEQRQCQVIIIPMQHGTEQRVVVPAQGRVGRDITNKNVHALFTPLLRSGLRSLGGKIALVGQASGKQVTVLNRLKREFWRDKQIPQHVIAGQGTVTGVAGIIRQPEHIAGKLTCLERLGQARLEYGIGIVAFQQVDDGHTQGHDISLALPGLLNKGDAAAPAKQQSCEHRH